MASTVSKVVQVAKKEPSLVLKRLIGQQAALSSSSEQERLLDADNCLLVDEDDRIVGGATKRSAHHKSTMALHRAFSVFAFTPQKKLILQKRAASKITFPSLWTNTCCSHPLSGLNPPEEDGEEGVKRAAVRKLAHELNLNGVKEDEMVCMGRFHYEAIMESCEWGEHEMDYALILKGVEEERVQRCNPDEVETVRFVTADELREWIQKDGSSFTPWFRLFHGLGCLDDWWEKLDCDKRLWAAKKEEIERM